MSESKTRDGDRKVFSLRDAVRQLREQETKRQIERIPVAQLTRCKTNARTHSPKQLRQIAASIKRFGFTVPVLVNVQNEILAGHGRVEAAKLLGLTEVPVLRLDHLSPVEQRAYVLADNRLAELAGWDRETLALELQSLIELDFAVELTGFEVGEIDLMLDDADAVDEEGSGAAAKPRKRSRGGAITRSGDVWRLGVHRLSCSDSPGQDGYAAIDAAIRCWQKATGSSATLADGQTFQEIARKRRKARASRPAGVGKTSEAA